MKCLVTGAGGFIGSHLVDGLINAGHSVTALDDLSGGFTENVNRQARFVELSILDHEAIDELFATERFDYDITWQPMRRRG